MSSQSLFILSTPSQAFFLSKAPELLENAVVVVTISNKKNAVKIFKYLQDINLNHTATVYLAKNNDLFKLPKIIYFRIWLLLFKQKFEIFKNVYIGSYTNFYHLGILAEYEDKAKLFLLYDGGQIIPVAKMRKTANHKVRNLPRSFVKMGIKQPQVNSLNFVAPFKLSVSKSDSVKVLNNDARVKHPSLDESQVYFVGQPLVDLEIVSKEFYLETLRLVKDKFPDKRLVYVPHPREDKNNLKHIQNIMEIDFFEDIFEEKFLNSEIFAQTIISFYSSVLFNFCYLNAGTNLYAINIPEANFLRKSIYHNIQIIYAYIEQAKYHNLNILYL